MRDHFSLPFADVPANNRRRGSQDQLVKYSMPVRTGEIPAFPARKRVPSCRKRFRNPGRKPGVMITARQMHNRRAQQQFQTFRGKGSDANCVTRAKNRVGVTLAVLLSGQPEARADFRGHLAGPQSSCSSRCDFRANVVDGGDPAECRFSSKVRMRLSVGPTC